MPARTLAHIAALGLVAATSPAAVAVAAPVAAAAAPLAAMPEPREFSVPENPFAMPAMGMLGQPGCDLGTIIYDYAEAASFFFSSLDQGLLFAIQDAAGTLDPCTTSTFGALIVQFGDSCQ